MLHTSCAAMMGGPTPSWARQIGRMPAGDGVTFIATVPLRHGRYTMFPWTTTPPSMTSPQPEGTAAICPPTPPSRPARSRYDIPDLPAATTRPLSSSAGSVERSASLALSWAHDAGAKEDRTRIDAESSTTPSLPS